jgi:hypothetical protein
MTERHQKSNIMLYAVTTSKKGSKNISNIQYCNFKGNMVKPQQIWWMLQLLQSRYNRKIVLIKLVKLLTLLLNSPEMEFLNINITKDLSLLLNAIHSPFYWRILKKTKLVFGLKNPLKKSVKQENSSIFMNCIL